MPAAAAAISEAAASMLLARAGQTDFQFAVAHLKAIEGADGLLGFDLRTHFHESKAFGLTAIPVLDQRH